MSNPDDTERTKPSLEHYLIPESPAGERPAAQESARMFFSTSGARRRPTKPKTPADRIPNRLTNRKKPQAKLIAIEPRLITTALRQLDLIQYLTLENLLEDQRAFIFGALQKGLPVEPGVHTARIENFKLVVR
jgi:hypothetical protein